MRYQGTTGTRILAITMALGIALGFGAMALAGHHEKGVKKVEKVKVVEVEGDERCEGEDCPEIRRHRIVIKTAGGEEVVHSCEGDDCEYHGSDMHKAHVMLGEHLRMLEDCEGEDCKDVRKVIVRKSGKGMSSHPLAGHHIEIEDDCEGDDCKKVRHIFVSRGDAASEIHVTGDEDFEWVSDDCEGEECEEIRARLMKIHGGHGSEGHGHAFFSGDEHFGAGPARQGGFLGVQLTELTADLRTHFGAPADEGVMVGSVVAESAAQQAGLQVGDIVTAVNGNAVGSAAALSRAIGGLEPGTTVELSVLRDGVSSSLTAVLGEREMKAAPRMHKIVVMCEEGNEDCEVDTHTAMFDCGEAEECEVEVMCEGDECTCTVNGEPMDCGEMDSPGHP